MLCGDLSSIDTFDTGEVEYRCKCQVVGSRTSRARVVTSEPALASWEPLRAQGGRRAPTGTGRPPLVPDLPGECTQRARLFRCSAVTSTSVATLTEGRFAARLSDSLNESVGMALRISGEFIVMTL
jgi:hypothetical protein